MKAFATIKHNDNERADRVTLYADDNGMVHTAADGEQPYPTAVSVVGAPLAWGGVWDYQPIATA